VADIFIVSREEILRRIRGEYLEMPGLRLTRPQAQRLWGLDELTCAQLLDSLAEEQFLLRRDDGRYSRLTDRPASFPPQRMGRGDSVGRLTFKLVS
jgi:hypothetical protein